MKSLHKVIDIIEFIAASGKAGIREISKHTGFPPATAHRIVATLVQRHYLEQDPTTKGYLLSLKFLELGSLVQSRFDLPRHARPHLELLMAETKESASLVVRDGDEAVYLDHVQDDHLLQLFTRIGARVPLYATGVGKALLAGMTKEELSAYLKRVARRRYTAKTLTDEEALRRELAAAAQRGWAVDDEEMEEGVRCVAAPVYNHSGGVDAAISVSGAAVRIPPDRFEEIGRLVCYRALAISRALGFNVESKDNKRGVSWEK